MSAGAPEAAEPQIEEKTEDVEVPAESEEGGEADPAAAAAEPGRRERRQNRMREETQAREAAERRAADFERQVSEQGRQIAEMRGRMAAEAERAQRGDPGAERGKQIERLEDEAQGHLERAAMLAKTDPAGAKREMRAYNAKLREAGGLETAAKLTEQFEQRFQQLAGQIPNPAMLATRESLGKDFPWLYSDDEARAVTDAIIDKLVSQGHPMSLETFRVAATQAQKRLGIGGRQAPTQQQRQRFAGVSGTEGAGDETGAPTIKVGAAEEKLALAAANAKGLNLDKKAAVKWWAGEMAKRQRGK